MLLLLLYNIFIIYFYSFYINQFIIYKRLFLSSKGICVYLSSFLRLHCRLISLYYRCCYVNDMISVLMVIFYFLVVLFPNFSHSLSISIFIFLSFKNNNFSRFLIRNNMNIIMNIVTWKSSTKLCCLIIFFIYSLY